MAVIISSFRRNDSESLETSSIYPLDEQVQVHINE